MTIYNFSAGPAVLPRDVLLQVQTELVDWHGSGMSVMEMSHRGKEFMGIAAQAEADLRDLMGVPKNYKVLFLQGGGQLPVIGRGRLEQARIAQQGILQEVEIGLHIVGDFAGQKQLLLVELFLEGDFDFMVELLPEGVKEHG